MATGQVGEAHCAGPEGGAPPPRREGPAASPAAQLRTLPLSIVRLALLGTQRYLPAPKISIFSKQFLQLAHSYAQSGKIMNNNIIRKLQKCLVMHFA